MDAAAGGAEQNRSNEQSDTGKNEAELELLRVKLAYTERERDELQRREREQGQQHRDERERLLGIIETQTQQIKELAALPKSTQEPEPEPKRGFWQRLFG